MCAIKLWKLAVSLSAVQFCGAQFSFPASSLSGMYGQPNPGTFLPPGQPSPLISRHSMPFSPNMHFGTILSNPSLQDDMLIRPGMQSPGNLHALPSGSMHMPSGLSPADLALQSQEQPFGRPSPASIFAARRAGMFGLPGGSGAYDSAGSRPDTPDMMQPQFPMHFDNSGGLPGGSGLPPFTLTGSPFRGDGMGVSYFPVGRFRPGAEVFMMGTKTLADQEETGADAGVATLNDTVSANDSAAVNGTVKPSIIMVKKVIQPNESVSTLTDNVQTTSTTITPVKSQTSQPPCAHPVYMNRIFMSTALSMGLISANTSCIILVDH